MRSVNNADVRDELIALQRRVDTGDTTPEDAGPAFERLALSLSDVTRQEDALLRGWVNDIELICFTQRPENQKQAVVGVLRNARPVFERLA